MKVTAASAVLGMMLAAASLAAPVPLPDPTSTFAAIDTAVAARDYFLASAYIGNLQNAVLRFEVPVLGGQEFRRALDAGRANTDALALLQQVRFAWNQAGHGEVPWTEVRDKLAIASFAVGTLEEHLPPATRYQQARARYEADPTIILEHQLTMRAFEAQEYDATLQNIAKERPETIRIYPPEALGWLLNRLDTMVGIIKFNQGDTPAAIQALKDSAADLETYHEGRRLRDAPRMLLAQKLLHAGQTEPVLAYLAECEKFEYPGGEEYTDVGHNLNAPSQLIAAIQAGKEPQFSALDLF